MPRGWTVLPEEPGVTEIHSPVPEAPASRQLRSEVPRTRRSEEALEPVQPGSGEEESETRWEFVHLRAWKRSNADMCRTIQTGVSTVRALRQITRRGLHSHRNRSVCDKRVAAPGRDGRGRRRGVFPTRKQTTFAVQAGCAALVAQLGDCDSCSRHSAHPTSRTRPRFCWYTGNPSEGVRCKAPLHCIAEPRDHD